MRRVTFVGGLVLLVAVGGRAEFIVAEEGRAKCTIVQDSAATQPEKNAARELARTLQEITGAEFPIKESGTDGALIVVGQGALAQKLSRRRLLPKWIRRKR